MKVLFNIGHPAHVHLFKNLIWNLEKKGHHCLITTIDKDVSIQLLEAYKFNYQIIGRGMPTLFSKAQELVRIEWRLYQIAKVFKPDVLVGGVGNAYVAHVGKVLRKPSVVFDDTEHAKIEHFLMDPFVTAICTPSCYRTDLGKKQIRYKGCHELAYLHPKYYTPDPSVIEELGFSRNDNIFLVRFAAFNASHDIQSQNFNKEYVPILMNKLESRGHVVISSEIKLSNNLKKYEYNIQPSKYHDVLYHSKLYVGESSTSAEEAAVMGVPSIHFERLSISGKNCGISQFIGVLDELQNRYGLLYSFWDEKKLLEKVDSILYDINKSCNEWKTKQQTLLNDSINVTEFMESLVEGYGQHYNKDYKNN